MNRIDTPAFKKWFGKSKVVDTSGKPLVVYHGTAGNFWTFEPGMRGSYFTVDPKEALVYAERQTDPSYGENLKPRVISAYLRVEKPFDPDVNALPGVDLGTGTWEFLERHFNKIRSAGYDGIRVKEMSDTPDRWKDWVVFDPTQIKSATENRGTFDPADPDIRNPRTTPKQFPYDYAAYLKANFPDIWKAGGNIRGNDTFRWWSAFRKGDRSSTVMYWWNTTRPAWIARHYRDHRLPGVIAQIKWGTVGTLGVAGMKRVVEDAIRKRYA